MDELKRIILEEFPEISTGTRNNHLCKLRVISRIIDFPIEELFDRPEDFHDCIEKYRAKRNLSVGTILGYYSTISSLIKHGNITCDNNKWMEVFRCRSDAQRKVNESNIPSVREASAYVPWSSIIERRDKLLPGSIDRLLLCMYTMIPPQRNDFYDVSFDGSTDNHIDLDKKVLVMRNYKTHSRYGDRYIDLPDELIDEINCSLRREPRQRLFQHFPGRVYIKSSFNRFVNDRLRVLFNYNFTISTFRHVFISDTVLNRERISLHECRTIARLMGHSVEMQKQYQRFY